MGLKPRNPAFQCVQAELIVPGSPQAGLLRMNAMKSAVALKAVPCLGHRIGLGLVRTIHPHFFCQDETMAWNVQERDHLGRGEGQ